MARFSDRVMANRFDPVPVGIPEERRVIGGVILAQTRRAVTAAAGSDARVPERIALGPPLRLEAPVAAGALFRLLALVDRDVDPVRIGGARPFAVTQPVVAAADLDDVERLHDGVVEALGGGHVRNGN